MADHKTPFVSSEVEIRFTAMDAVDWIHDHPRATGFLCGVIGTGITALLCGGLAYNEIGYGIIGGLACLSITILGCIAIDALDA